MTMRVTQRVMISRAVTRSVVGFQVFNADLGFEISEGSGQPRVERGQRPLENQVSRTSGSWVKSLWRNESGSGSGSLRKQTCNSFPSLLSANATSSPNSKESARLNTAVGSNPGR